VKPESDHCLSIRAVAELLGVHPETARKWCRKGKFPNGFHLPNGSGWRVPRSDVPPLSGSGGDEKTERPAPNPALSSVSRLQLLYLTQRLDGIERRLEALGAKPLRESASSVTDQGSASQATTVQTRQPVLCNSEGKMLCFSSPEARAAYVEAFADWERPGFDTEAKSRDMPDSLGSAYWTGLKRQGGREASVSVVDQPICDSTSFRALPRGSTTTIDSTCQDQLTLPLFPNKSAEPSTLLACQGFVVRPARQRQLRRSGKTTCQLEGGLAWP
jgi:excisionase family DNA binding protein